jgi:PAS domain S-box-containing protein
MSRLSADDSREPSILARYGVALLASTLALLLTWLLRSFMERNLFLWFFAAIVIGSWYGGLGPGLLVTVVASIGIGYFFIAPFSLFDSGSENLLRLGVFMLVALLISSLTAARRRSAQAAQAQREQLRVTLSSIGDAVIATDMHGRVTLINTVAESLTGWNSADALGQDIAGIFRIVNEETHQIVESPVERALREGAVVGLANHTLLIARDGAERPIDDSGAPIRDRQGAITGVVLVFRDITARKQAEDTLARYQLLSENARDIMLFIRQDGRIIEANRAAVAAYGYDRDALLGKTIYDLRDPATVPDVDTQMQQTDSGGILFETVHRRADGTLFPVEVSSIGAVINRRLVLVSIIRDISARRRIEAAQTQLAALVQSTDDAIIGKTLEGTIISWNAAAERIYGYSAEEAIGRSIQMLAPPDQPDEIPQILEQLKHGERIARLETTRMRKDTTLIDVSLTISPIRDANGAISAASTIARDISERKRNEAALRESEQRFRTMADSAPVLIWISGTDMLCTFFNQAWLDFTGRAMEQELGNGWAEGVHPDDFERYLAIHSSQFKRRLPFTIEYRLRRADGVYRWVLDNGVPRFAPDGQFAGYSGSCIDITERKQAADRSAYLQTISNALSEALTPTQVADAVIAQGIAAIGSQAGSIALLSEDGDALEVISATGYPVHVLDSWRRFSLSQPIPLAEAVRSKTMIMIESPAELAERYPQLGQPALPESYAWAAIPLLVEGRVSGALGLSFGQARKFSIDERAFLLTLASQCAQALERARLYEAERQARAQAEAAVRLRDQFLSIAAHELKTPLTSLLGYAQLFQRRTLRAGSLGEADQRALGVIVAQSLRLNRMIAALLDTARIENGQLSINRAPLDLCELARRVVEEARDQAEEHPLEITCQPEQLLIEGDDLRLEQVLQNLIQNAIKYSPPGAPVAVRIERQGAYASVAVADRGIGIPEAARARLFQRFYRAPNVDERQISGMGIGLFVVKEIVMLHDGTVDVESIEGQGSMFTIRLPLVPGDE